MEFRVSSNRRPDGTQKKNAEHTNGNRRRHTTNRLRARWVRADGAPTTVTELFEVRGAPDIPGQAQTSRPTRSLKPLRTPPTCHPRSRLRNSSGRSRRTARRRRRRTQDCQPPPFAVAATAPTCIRRPYGIPAAPAPAPAVFRPALAADHPPAICRQEEE